jgi:hypothetical protein
VRALDNKSLLIDGPSRQKFPSKPSQEEPLVDIRHISSGTRR